MGFPVEDVRREFPVLVNRAVKRPFRYFDSACVTLRPRAVIDAVREYYESFPGCHGRAVYRLGREVTRRYDEAHAAAADLIGARSPSHVIFLRNATEGINAVCQALDFQPDQVVLSSDIEHNSNLLPWQAAAGKKRLVHRIFPTREDGTFDLGMFQRDFPANCRLLAVHATSNVTGASLPLEAIVGEAHAREALVLVDAAQSMVTSPPDVGRLGVDFLVFSAHKMFGPSGLGVLYAAPHAQQMMQPWMLGGEAVTDASYAGHTLAEAPDRWEAGLQDYAGACGLTAAIRFLRALDREALLEHLTALNRRLSEGLAALPGLHLLGPADPAERPAIVNVVIDGIDAHHVAALLDDAAGVMVRSGMHCCHAWYRARRVPESVRFSLSVYNTREEVEVAIDTLRKILRHLRRGGPR